jgi:nucleotide-binding universal stress UspA family protein
MKIFLSVDGSDYTKRMLGYVAAHEELFGPAHEYVVMTAVAPVPPQVTHFVERSIIEDFYRERADHVLNPVKAFAAQKGWKVRALHAVGAAAQTIADAAEAEKPDLIVMGSHGHSALANVVMGSVVSGVLARCRVPMLLIR